MFIYNFSITNFDVNLTISKFFSSRNCALSVITLCFCKSVDEQDWLYLRSYETIVITVMIVDANFNVIHFCCIVLFLYSRVSVRTWRDTIHMCYRKTNEDLVQKSIKNIILFWHIWFEDAVLEVMKIYEKISHVPMEGKMIDSSNKL